MGISYLAQKTGHKNQCNWQQLNINIYATRKQLLCKGINTLHTGLTSIRSVLAIKLIRKVKNNNLYLSIDYIKSHDIIYGLN